MKFLIIGDPLRNLKPKTDTSLALLREMLLRTYEVHWATDQDLALWDGRVFARVENTVECPGGSFPAVERIPEWQPINSYDVVLVRKDPPFDTNYQALCWLLALEENNVPIWNKPSLLLRYHEKMLPWEALEQGFLFKDDLIPTLMPTGHRFAVPSDFPRGQVVQKPWLGHGGKDVRLLDSPKTPDAYTLLQPFQKEVHTTGDRRVLYLAGEILGSFTRIPAEGEIKANLAAGGRADPTPMNKREEAVAERVGEFLKKVGIQFAGLDLLNEMVSEINITSPTGVMTYKELFGINFASPIVNHLEALADS